MTKSLNREDVVYAIYLEYFTEHHDNFIALTPTQKAEVIVYTLTKWIEEGESAWDWNNKEDKEW